jgi:hypothetical protein
LSVERSGTRLRGVRPVWMCCVWARGRLRMRGRNWALLGTASMETGGSGRLTKAGKEEETAALMSCPLPRREAGVCAGRIRPIWLHVYGPVGHAVEVLV